MSIRLGSSSMDAGRNRWLMLLLLLLLRLPSINGLIVGMVLLASPIDRWVRELLMLWMLLLLLLLLLLLVRAWLWHGSKRVWRELVVHVDGIVRAILHICGMFRHGSRGYLDGM